MVTGIPSSLGEVGLPALPRGLITDPGPMEKETDWERLLQSSPSALEALGDRPLELLGDWLFFPAPRHHAGLVSSRMLPLLRSSSLSSILLLFFGDTSFGSRSFRRSRLRYALGLLERPSTATVPPNPPGSAGVLMKRRRTFGFLRICSTFLISNIWRMLPLRTMAYLIAMGTRIA